MTTPDKNRLLIYGAYGYTGELISELVAQKKINAIISGRDETQTQQLAKRLNLEARVFSLDNKDAVDSNLKDVSVVLNCAGPFFRTAADMIKACLRNNCHYLDITGEIGVFEEAAYFDSKAKAAGIMVLPGAGFDVVPSDCLAAHLKNLLPDATELKLAFTSVGGGVSRGTATTIIENIDKGGAVRKEGKIKLVPPAWKTKTINFGKISRLCATIPWGDVSTAWRSTGIPDIEVYMAVKPSAVRMMKLGSYFNWILGTDFVKQYLIKKVRSGKPGPDAEERRTGKSLLYGEVRNAKGETRSANLTCPEGYFLTASTSVLIAEKVLSGNFKTGFMTPSMAYGEGLISEIDGVEWKE